MLEMALVENIQRVDLNAIEVALSYQRLIDECNFTQEQLSQKVGKSRSNIANFLRLLKLPAPIQIGIRQGFISMGHARAIVSSGDEATQLLLFEKVMEEGLSVRAVENLIKDKKIDKPQINKKPEIPKLSSFAESFQNRLSKQLNIKVQIAANNNGQGKIVINFESEEELDKIIDFIDRNNG
jgi:ParB family chromosome partitioning protein